MLELRGREIRISHISDASGSMRIRSGSIVEMIGGAYHQSSSASSLKINCDSIQRYLKPNDVVYFDDGKVVGIVIEISGNGCKMEIKLGGTIQARCQVRFTGGKHTNLPILTKEDVEDLMAISQISLIDYIAVPFITKQDDVKEIKEKLGEGGKDIKILAKVDNMEAVTNFESIMKSADGSIFVRNELQWELQAEKLMLAQKWCIEHSNFSAKPIMLQSQILESMVNPKNGMPERVELTEISTAVMHGADCFILSHETSISKFGAEAVTYLAKGIAEAESIYDHE